MGEALDRLIALAGTERVSGYTRQSSTGKTVHVGAYTRSPGSLSNDELQTEYGQLTRPNVSVGGLDATQKVNRLDRVEKEIAARKRAGTWGSSNDPTGKWGSQNTGAETDRKYSALDRLKGLKKKDAQSDSDAQSVLSGMQGKWANENENRLKAKDDEESKKRSEERRASTRTEYEKHKADLAEADDEKLKAAPYDSDALSMAKRDIRNERASKSSNITPEQARILELAQDEVADKPGKKPASPEHVAAVKALEEAFKSGDKASIAKAAEALKNSGDFVLGNIGRNLSNISLSAAVEAPAEPAVSPVDALKQKTQTASPEVSAVEALVEKVVPEEDEKPDIDDVIAKYSMTGMDPMENYAMTAQVAKDMDISWLEARDQILAHTKDADRSTYGKASMASRLLQMQQNLDPSTPEYAKALLNTTQQGYYEATESERNAWAEKVVANGEDPLKWIRQNLKKETGKQSILDYVKKKDDEDE